MSSSVMERFHTRRSIICILYKFIFQYAILINISRWYVWLTILFFIIYTKPLSTRYFIAHILHISRRAYVCTNRYYDGQKFRHHGDDWKWRNLELSCRTQRHQLVYNYYFDATSLTNYYVPGGCLHQSCNVFLLDQFCM